MRVSVQRGFTLIELLVVVTAISILSGMAVVSLNIGGYDDQLRDEARRLFALTRIAADDAIFKSAQLGVRFTHSEYTFYTLQDTPPDAPDTNFGAQDDNDAVVRRWVATEDHAQLHTREWPEDIKLEVFVEGLPIVLDEQRDAKAEADKTDFRPHLIFLSNGEVLPDVEVRLGSTESEKTWRVGIGEDGVLAYGLVDES